MTEEEAGGEELRIADPIEPWNRAMYHVNDKLYFWLFKPAAKGYKYVVPEDVRGLFSNFYENLKAPIRIVNNVPAREARVRRDLSWPGFSSTPPSASGA